MKFIDLCAGIGGFHKAFQSYGECVLSCEIDKYAQLTYKANFPHTPIHDDVTTLKDIPPYDIMLAGFPCQAFSNAGLKRGFDDDRGNIFFYLANILKETQPTMFLFENVPALLTHNKGETFKSICNVLHLLGYNYTYQIVNANAFVPQNRKRLFILGHKHIQPTLDIPLPEHGGTLSDILENVDEKYTLSEKMYECLQRHKAKHVSRGNGFGYTLHTPNDVANTLTARYGKDGSEILIAQEPRPRRLSPRECAKLMGWPDVILPVSDTQAYKQLGNSVVVPVVEAIAKHIINNKML